MVWRGQAANGTVQVEYKCTDHYDPSSEISIADPDLAIPWRISNPILSSRDAAAPQLRDLVDRLPVYTRPEARSSGLPGQGLEPGQADRGRAGEKAERLKHDARRAR